MSQQTLRCKESKQQPQRENVFRVSQSKRVHLAVRDLFTLVLRIYRGLSAVIENSFRLISY